MVMLMCDKHMHGKINDFVFSSFSQSDSQLKLVIPLFKN